MPLGAFYGSLSASASIFIGILSAYLVNTLVNTRQEQTQLRRQQTQNEHTLDTLRGQRDQYQSRIDEIETMWHDRDVDHAHNRVDSFLRRKINPYEYTNPPEILSEVDIRQIFAEDQEYESIEELTDIEKQVLVERRSDINIELADVTAKAFVRNEFKDSSSLKMTVDEMVERFREYYHIKNLWPVTRNAVIRNFEKEEKNRLGLSGFDPDFAESLSVDPPVPSITATIAEQRNTRESAEHTQNKLRLIEAKARIEEYEKQQEDIADRLKTLSLSQARKTLRVSEITILASVVLPLLTYLFYELDVYFFRGRWVAPCVFVIWLVGLVYVLRRLRHQVSENDD